MNYLLLMLTEYVVIYTKLLHIEMRFNKEMIATKRLSFIEVAVKRCCGHRKDFMRKSVTFVTG